LDYKKAHKIYRQRFEDPASFTFVFVGNVNPKKMKPLIEKYLGGLPADKKDEKFKDVGAELPTGKIIKCIARKGTENKSMDYMVYTGNEEYSLENALLLKAVSEVFTNRLLDSIREEKALTYSISANAGFKYFPKNQYGVYIFFSSAPDTVDYIVKEIEKIANSLKDVKNISDEDLKKTVEKLKKEYETNIRENKYWLSQLEKYEKLGKYPDFATKYNDIVDSITKQKIVDTAKKFLNNSSYAVISLQPEKVEKQ
jgi:zinc protease